MNELIINDRLKELIRNVLRGYMSPLCCSGIEFLEILNDEIVQDK